jgi:hypothetical protein
MKINKILILFVLIGCILAAGYFIKSTTKTTTENSTSPVKIPITQGLTPVPVLTDNSFSVGKGQGQVLITIGEYNDNLSVFADDVNSGNVSNGIPLSLNLFEGSHTIKVCSGTFCESVGQNIQSGIKTTVDFEQRLIENHPEGSLKVSLGDYSASLNVSVDNSTRGYVTTAKPIVMAIGPGYHSVEICPNEECFTRTVEVTPFNQTLVDFGSELISQVKQADLTVTIGGYKATLPVLIDNQNVGNVSYEKALTIRTSAGTHEVKVCSGVICEKETVVLKFGKPTNIDFGDRLKKDVEFPDPIARIADYSANGADMNIDVEFINPTTKDLMMTPTVSTAYTYLDYSSSVRVGASKIAHVSANVTAGQRDTEYLYMYLGGGESVTASIPVVISVTMK